MKSKNYNKWLSTSHLEKVNIILHKKKPENPLPLILTALPQGERQNKRQQTCDDTRGMMMDKMVEGIFVQNHRINEQFKQTKTCNNGDENHKKQTRR